MAQLVEHILGKDEVPSSNLGSSSRQPRSSLSLGALVFILISAPSLTYRRGCRELLLVLRARFSDEAENRFAYPARSSKSSLLRRRARVSSPWRISVQTTPKLIEPRGCFFYYSSLTGHVHLSFFMKAFILHPASPIICLPYRTTLIAPIVASAPTASIKHPLCLFLSVLLKNIIFPLFS